MITKLGQRWRAWREQRRRVKLLRDKVGKIVNLDPQDYQPTIRNR